MHQLGATDWAITVDIEENQCFNEKFQFVKRAGGAVPRLRMDSKIFEAMKHLQEKSRSIKRDNITNIPLSEDLLERN